MKLTPLDSSLNRRDFLLRSARLAAAGWLAGGRLLAQTAASTTPATVAGQLANPPPVVPEFRPLRRNVGFFTARGGTIGWLAAPDALAVVDTQFADTAALCLAGLPGRANRTIDVVLNTHHHADHTSGNGVFKPVAKTIVAQANVPALQRAAAERAKPPTIDQQVYADTTFAESWRQELGDEGVSARYFGAAHTNGDAVILFEKANVVHLGDLVFNRMYPVIDRGSGGSFRHWLVVLEKIAREYPADAIYIFGHGNSKFGVTGPRSDLFVIRDYITSLLEHVQAQIAAGKTKAEISTMENFPGFPDFHQKLPNRLGSNLGAAYDELTEAKR
jgi:glyoxylase-like metal-dependent hydrolase (beta-lactamase superfamily II)